MNGPINRQFSILGALSLDGMCGFEITELARASTATNMPKAMDTMGFLDSFVKAVLPCLRPFPQPNRYHHSVSSRHSIRQRCLI